MKTVKAKSVKDFLNKYYKKDRMTDTLLERYENELKEEGYVFISRHDNVTGETIKWSPTV